jgi:lysophospholipase L1-like esterase
MRMSGAIVKYFSVRRISIGVRAYLGAICVLFITCIYVDAASDILLLGDSWVNGRDRLAKPLAQYFEANGGLAGAGYCGLVGSNGSAASEMVYFYGNSGWQVRDKVTDAIGVDITSVTGTAVNQELRFLLKSDVDEVEIYYRAQPGGGSFAVYDDSDLLVTVNTNSDEFVNEVHRPDWSSRSSRTTIKLVVTDPSESGVRLAGFNFRAYSGAVRVHEMGTGGITAGRFVSVDRSAWIDSVRQLRPEIVCVLLGTNDHASNVSPASFKSSIEELVERVQQARPYAEILLLSPGENGLQDRVYEMTDYRDQLAEIAVEREIGFVDLHAQLGDYADANAEGLYKDSVHPNAAGGLLIRDAVVSMLDVRNSGDINLIKLWDTDELLENMDLSCEVGTEAVTLHWRQFPGVSYTLKESVNLETWTPVVLPETRGNMEQSTIIDRSDSHFWKFEASYPLLWSQ